MKIGELARKTQTPVETVRYYERQGLLAKAARSEANYRIYGPEQVQRLAFVRHCRSLDMTLDEIRALLRFKDAPSAERTDCSGVDALLDEHIGHVAQRIRELKLLQQQLKALREQCAGSRNNQPCGILTQLTKVAALNLPPGPVRHLAGTHGSQDSSARPKNRATEPPA